MPSKETLGWWRKAAPIRWPAHQEPCHVDDCRWSLACATGAGDTRWRQRERQLGPHRGERRPPGTPALSTIADGPSRARPAPVTPAGGSGSGNWYRTEDAWAIVLGVGLVAVAVLAFLHGASLKWLAVAPQRWSAPAEIGQQLRT